MLFRSEKWGEVGRAFLEAVPGVELEVATVARFLEGKLARFKLPKRIIILPTLPRIGSGKIDKQALKEIP